jgi:hypothetical protein
MRRDTVRCGSHIFRCGLEPVYGWRVGRVSGDWLYVSRIRDGPVPLRFLAIHAIFRCIGSPEPAEVGMGFRLLMPG